MLLIFNLGIQVIFSPYGYHQHRKFTLNPWNNASTKKRCLQSHACISKFHFGPLDPRAASSSAVSNGTPFNFPQHTICKFCSTMAMSTPDHNLTSQNWFWRFKVRSQDLTSWDQWPLNVQCNLTRVSLLPHKSSCPLTLCLTQVPTL